MKAVNEILTEHGGRGLVQRACLGAFNDDEAHQYAYGNVVAEAVAEDGAVMWRKP